MAKTAKLLLPDDLDEPDADSECQIIDLHHSETSQRKNGCRQTTQILLCAISAVLCIYSVTMLCLVFSTTGHSHKTSLNQTASHDIPEICMDCMKILKNPFNPIENDPLVDRLVKKMDHGIQKCCAQSSEQLSALLEKMMNRESATMPVYVDKIQLKFTPASAHKRLMPPERNSKVLTFINEHLDPFPEGGHIVLQFEPNYHDPVVEHARGVEVTQDAIEIKYTGLYYVYSSVNFQPNSSLSILNQNKMTWSYYVYYTNPSHTIILLMAHHSASSPTAAETTYAGGVFQLKATDRIQVCLYTPGVVKSDKESTFLGLYMIKSGAEEN